MFAVGTKVKCTAHAGAHVGIVAEQLGNAGYGIEWESVVRLPRTAEERAHMKAFSKAHGRDMVAAPADAVEAV